MENAVKWILKVKAGLMDFIDSMASDDYSYFKYSYSGDLFTEKQSWGLGNMVFAVKILCISSLLDQLPEATKQNMYKSIIRFSGKNGYIFDPLITKQSLTEKLFKSKQKISSQYLEEVRRAETRQSFSALYLLGKKPEEPFGGIPANNEGIEKYLTDMDWSVPWHSGSHFSHLLFFLKMNGHFFTDSQDNKKLIDYTISRIEKIQSPVDGMWYIKDISLAEKINGAMKIITGYHAASIDEIPYSKKIIDTALTGINDAEACSNFNIAYVLYGACKNEPEYRKQEVQDFLLNRISLYKKYYHEDKKGFSFRMNKANDNYYGKIISEGRDEPDIHGTIMFTWGLAIISEVLGLDTDMKIPVN